MCTDENVKVINRFPRSHVTLSKTMSVKLSRVNAVVYSQSKRVEFI